MTPSRSWRGIFVGVGDDSSPRRAGPRARSRVEGEGRDGGARVGVPRVRPAVCGGADLCVRAVLRAARGRVRSGRARRTGAPGTDHGRSGLDLAISGSAARLPGSGVGPGARVDTADSGAPARRGAGTPKP